MRISPAGRRGLIGALVFLPIAAGLAWWQLRPFYHQQRADRYCARAQTSMDEGNVTAARLALNNAFRHEPRHPGAWRCYARLLATEQSPDTMRAFYAAWQADPDNVSTVVDALLTAGSAQDVPTGHLIAREAVQRFPSNAALWNAIGRFLQTAREAGASLQAFDQAAGLEPGNDDYRFNAAVAALLSPDAERAQRAKQTVESFVLLPRYTDTARAALAAHTGRTNTGAAVPLWDALAESGSAAWPARVQAVISRHVSDPDATRGQLAALFAAATNAQQRSDTVVTAAGLQATNAVLDLFAQLPLAEQRTALLFNLWAMEQAANGSWSALDAFCVDAERATLPPDDHVPILLWHWRTVQALPGREDGPTLLDRAAERVAQRLDLALPAALTLEGWGFPAEAARFDTQGAAAGSPVRVQCLGRQLQAANRDRDLGRLLQASQALLALGPDNPDLLNNVAYARLALNPGDTNAAREVEDARRAFPQSVWLQATHAWVLHLQGRRAESLEAYEQLDPVTLQSPQVRLRCAEARLSTGLTNGVPELLLPVRDELLFPEERPALQHLRDALRAPSTP